MFRAAEMHESPSYRPLSNELNQRFRPGAATRAIPEQPLEIALISLVNGYRDVGRAPPALRSSRRC